MNMSFESIRSVVARLGSDESYRVLIAEDHADLARVMAMLLRHCGFDVKMVHDGRLVLSIARQFRPHFILLDIGLPGMSGREVAVKLRQDDEFDQAMIIAISAHGPDMFAVHSEKPPFNHHLTKPVSLDDLLAVMIPRG